MDWQSLCLILTTIGVGMILVYSFSETRPSPNSIEMTAEEPGALGEMGGDLMATVFPNPAEVALGVVMISTVLSLVVKAWNTGPGRIGLWLSVVTPIGFFINITFSLHALNILYGLGAPHFLLKYTWFYLTGVVFVSGVFNRLGVDLWDSEAPNRVKAIRLAIIMVGFWTLLLVTVNADVGLPHTVYKAGILLFMVALSVLISLELNASFWWHLISMIVCGFLMWCALTKGEHNVLLYISEWLTPLIALLPHPPCVDL